MSGVFDSATGTFIMRRSTMAAEIPEGWVAQYGGHGAVRQDLAAALGEDLTSAAPGRLSGFSVTKGANGDAQFGWNSGTINPASHGSRAVPEAVRPQIESAVRGSLDM
jgi:hypothetical protein